MTLCVLGGGIAGLTAAHYALNNPAVKRIVVLESSSRLGGWIQTTRNPDGVLYEKGPRTVRPAGPQGANTLALVEDLGLADSVRPITYSHPSSTNRLVLVGGKLHKLPSTLSSVFRNLPPFSRPLALAVFKDLLSPRIKCEDTSLYEFVARRLGNDIAQYAIDPMVRGICAGDSKQVSVHFIAKYLHQMEQETGRITFGVARDYLKGLVVKPEVPMAEHLELVKQARGEKWAVWGLENGLESLVETLQKSLIDRGVEIKTGVSVENIALNNRQVVVSCDDDISCDKLVLALPAFKAAPLVQGISSELGSLLASIPFVDVALVNIEYKGKVLDHQGFGFLVPSNQPEQLLGCIYDSCTFPQGNRTVLTVMIGGAWYREMVGSKTADEVQIMAVEEISRILNIKASPVRCDTSILPQCIAQYTVGHRDRVEKARAVISKSDLPLALAGSSYDGPGINDTIVSAKNSVITM
eukprot:TRINITY_DN14382_c0_g1_i1.p1 TRINITY_DN14382_c0_g1~~TRINITY_DN14382_c0_g1_i1.p1  ORF type:complete len:468 (+),score=114.37 TRINITY_DN14382_c0_g1_i1:50-1453(+)